MDILIHEMARLAGTAASLLLAASCVAAQRYSDSVLLSDEATSHSLGLGYEIPDPSETAGATFTYVSLPSSSGGLCLDGSQYGFFICRPPAATQWQINLQGGCVMDYMARGHPC